MNENDKLESLRDPRNWDDEKAEARPPAGKPRAVVSVSFPREDFAWVARQASSLGMKTSEYIRKAALDQLGESAVSLRQGAGIQMSIPARLIEEGNEIELPTPVGPSGRPLPIASIPVARHGDGDFLTLELEPERRSTLARASGASSAVCAVFTDIESTFADGDEVTIDGVGAFAFESFKSDKRATRQGRNPQTRESVTIDAHKGPVVRPGTQFKRSVE